MAQFRTVADLLDAALRRAGEPTNGNSDLEADALEYMNRIHSSVIGGGLEFNVEVNEPWIWARAARPLVLDLQPKFNTGTVTLTNGSEVGAFSVAPASSLAGYFLRVSGRKEVYKIESHTGGATAFEINGNYIDDTITKEYKAFKTDYEIDLTHILINGENNSLDFEETASTELTATITGGVYTPAALATEIQSALTSAGASAFTVTYNSDTRKFTIVSDRAGGGGIFTLLLQSGTNQGTSIGETIGFDVEDQADSASHTSLYIQGGISRLIEPFRIDKGENRVGNIFSTDQISLQKDWPLTDVREGFPDLFSVIRETQDGRITIRFNRYPKDATKIELEHIPVPIDLKDNAQSVPRIPRKYSELLEFGTAFYLLTDKEDTKAAAMGQLAAAKLTAMMRENRVSLSRTGRDFGSVIPRLDNSRNVRRRFFDLIDPEGN